MAPLPDCFSSWSLNKRYLTYASLSWERCGGANETSVHRSVHRVWDGGSSDLIKQWNHSLCSPLDWRWQCINQEDDYTHRTREYIAWWGTTGLGGRRVQSAELHPAQPSYFDALWEIPWLESCLRHCLQAISLALAALFDIDPLCLLLRCRLVTVLLVVPKRCEI